MKRRDVLISLAATGASAALAPSLIETLEAQQSGELSVEQVAELLRAIARVEPRPGEAARVREALAGFRTTAQTDPRVQPALSFDPEVEL